MRINLNSRNEARGPDRDKDAWGVNCLLDDQMVKRPGAVQTVSADTLGQGLFMADGTPYAVIDDTFGEAINTPSAGSFVYSHTWDTDGEYLYSHRLQRFNGYNYTLVDSSSDTMATNSIYDWGTLTIVQSQHGFIAGSLMCTYSQSAGISFQYTSNGVTWTNAGSVFDVPCAPEANNIYSFYLGGVFYIQANRPIAGFVDRYSSPDGINFTFIETNALVFGTNYSGTVQSCIFTFNGKLTFLQRDGGATLTIVTSVDGIEWIIDPAYDLTTLYEDYTSNPILYFDGTDVYLGLSDCNAVFKIAAGTYTPVLLSASVFPAPELGSVIFVESGTLWCGRSTGGGFEWYYYVPGSEGSFQGAAMPVTTPGLPFDFVQTPDSAALPGFFFKSTADAFYYNGTTVTKVTDVDYPATTVRGVACLDGTFYVMDPNGKINGSEINNCLAWDALNFLQCQMEPDNGVYITRLLNFIVAFGTYTTEFFYDAGNATGSPLLPYASAMLNIGCAVAESVVQSNNQIFFMGVSKQKGRSIYAITGTTPEIISTASVERLVNADDLADISAFSVKISGHNFYVITLGTLGITLVYDLVMRDWKEWTSLTAAASKSVSSLTYSTSTGVVTVVTSTAHNVADGDPVVIAGAAQSGYNGAWVASYVDATTYTYIPDPAALPAVTPATGTITSVGYTSGPFIGKFYTGFGTEDLIQDASGNVYSLDPDLYQDNGVPIDVHIRTPLLDGGSNQKKFFSRLQVIGDMADTKVYVRYTGDDYQNWSKYRPVDMSKKRAKLNRLGDDRRRAFEVRHVGNTALRLEALELDVEQGVH